MRNGAMWVRVSSEDQHPEIYLPEMERWATARDELLEVAASATGTWR